MPSKLEHALALAENGFYVFPCDPDTNHPTVPWREVSTRNPLTIKDWFICPFLGFEQDYNIGVDCYKSGVTAIDIDVKDGKQGRVSFEKWQKEFGWGVTRMQKTASGGLHLIYKASGFRNSVEKLAPGIDVRSDGGFYVAAGSTKNGNTYILEHDIEPKPLPQWLEEKLAALGKAIAPVARDSSTTIMADNEDDIITAIAFLQNHPPAIEGDAGDNHTYITFCQLKERGISIQTALELAEEYWNPFCCPPWAYDDLVKKANSAYKSAQNATGSKSPYGEFDIPITPIESVPADSYNHGYLLPDALSFPARDWVFGKFALAKNVTLLIAPPGVGKSTFTLELALSKVSGKNILGIDPLERGTVVLFNNEDNVEEQSRRLVAAAQHFGIFNPDLCVDGISRLFVNGRDTSVLKIAKRGKDGSIKAENAEALVQYLIACNARLLIVDPLSMTHPANENSNEEMLTVGSIYAEIANRANCAVILVHHTRKIKESDSEGHNGNLDSARGASSLAGVVRIAYTLNVMDKQDAKAYGVDDEAKSRFILLEQAKANMAAPGEHKLFFERIGETVGIEGESVGVLAPKVFALPQRAIKPVAKVMMDYVENAVSEGERPVADLARELVMLPQFADKQPRTLEKRLTDFMHTDVYTGDTGTLYMAKRISGKRTFRVIHLKKNIPANLDTII